MTARDGPVHVAAEVLATKTVGAFHHLTLVAPGVGERSRPGSFLAVSVGDGHLARRAFWIHRVGPMGGHRAASRSWSRPAGRAAAALATLPVGAQIEVTGPLGRPFALPREPARCLLVGEGYAAAALTPAERLRERGCGVRMVLGGADDAHVLELLAARRSVGRWRSPRRPDRRRAPAPCPTPTWCTSPGPRQTHRFVAEAVAGTEVTCQVALERPLTCATGLCHGCPVPVLDDDGASHVVRACVDGPVFRAGRVRLGVAVVISVSDWPFANPVLTASGCGGTGRELAAYGELAELGGFVTRSVTRLARPGSEGRAWSSRRADWSTRSGSRTPASRRSSPTSCRRWWTSAPWSW